MRLGHLSEVELTEYADGELAAPRRQAAEAHLRGCPLCASLLAAARQTAALTGRLVPRDCPGTVRGQAAAALNRAPLRVSCRQVRGMMQERLDHRLSLAARVPFELHLRGCQACRAEFAALAGTTRLVRGLPLVEAPAWLRGQVLAAGPAARRRAPGAPRLRPVWAAAFALLVVGLVALLTPSVNSPELQQAQVPLSAPSVGGPQPTTIAEAPPIQQPEKVAQLSVPEVPERVVAGETPDERVAHVRLERPGPRGVKGPQPEVSLVRAETTPVTMPAALMALRTVARSASSEWSTAHGMKMAGERFAVLGSEAASEAMLAALPGAPEPGAAMSAGSRNEVPSPLETIPNSGQDTGAAQPTDSSAPVREGASLSVGPFV